MNDSRSPRALSNDPLRERSTEPAPQNGPAGAPSDLAFDELSAPVGHEWGA